MSLVKLTYHDNESITLEEIVAQAVKNYGQQVQVEITPESNLAYDYIYFGLQQLVTHQQVSILFDRDKIYNTEIKKLRDNILFKITEILDQVIIDNESKVG